MRKHLGYAHIPGRFAQQVNHFTQNVRNARDKSPQERKTFRSARATPILDETKTWLDEKLTQVLPKSPLGTAITYTLKLWPKLVTCLEDGHIEIDNNRAENAIRPFVIGRKGWLFSGSPRCTCQCDALYLGGIGQGERAGALGLSELSVRTTSGGQIGAGTAGLAAAEFNNGRPQRVGWITAVAQTLSPTFATQHSEKG